MLACVACFAIPAYLAFQGKASSSVSQSNVHAAVIAAETFSRGTGFYTGISGKRLHRQTPGIDPQIRAVAVNDDAGYCLEDSAGGKTYNYVGGMPGSALASGFQPATVEPGPCSAAVGAAAA